MLSLIQLKSPRLHQQCYHWTCAACFPWRGRTTCQHKAHWVEGVNGQLLPECVHKNESSRSHYICRAGLEATVCQEYQTFRVKGSSRLMNTKSLGWETAATHPATDRVSSVWFPWSPDGDVESCYEDTHSKMDFSFTWQQTRSSPILYESNLP